MSKPKTKPINHPAAAQHPRLIVNQYMAIKQCRHGLMMYNLNDSFVGRALDLYGEWCESELTALGQILHAGDVVVDAGANIGTHTLFFSKKVAPGGMVYAIEPQRMTYEILCANLALNGLLNVIPLQVALGDQPGQVNIPILDPTSQQNFAALNISGHSTGDSIELKPLDALQLPRCNLIKIDVEGMELQVLKGAEKTIQTCRPFLFVENNTRLGSADTVQALFDLGYNCWWHIAPYYHPNNFFHNPENVFSTIIPESNMICVPREFNLNVTGFEPVINISDNWFNALSRQGLVKEE